VPVDGFHDPHNVFFFQIPEGVRSCNGVGEGQDVVVASSQRRWKVLYANADLFAEEHRPFDGVLQFSDVSRPVIVHEGGKGFRLDTVYITLDLIAKLSHEVLDQNRNIFRSFTKGWQINSDYVEPVVEILSETAFLYQKLRI